MKGRLLSGIQPTGAIHLGNYLGAIQNWVELQPDYDTFIMIADLHSLTTSYENTTNIAEDTWNAAVDLLACGIDPKQTTLFIQSDIAAHSELHLILSMITPLSWLERVPTYKSKIEEMQGKHVDTYGFLGYPVLQAADILLYKTDVVPVGKDQLPHLELTREIVRRFHSLFGEVFIEPKSALTAVPLLPGLDGRKMSKSYGNTLALRENEAILEKKIMTMVTDPGRPRRTDNGHPEVCPVFAYQSLFYTVDNLELLAQGCRNAELGCVDCKKKLNQELQILLKPIREKRAYYLANPALVNDILAKGKNKASEVANHTLAQVKKAIKLKQHD